jgi:hypothetical protein
LILKQQSIGIDVKSYKQRSKYLEGLFELSAHFLQLQRIEELGIVLRPFEQGSWPYYFSSGYLIVRAFLGEMIAATKLVRD